MTGEPGAKLLERLRDRARRVQLVMGAGFLSWVLGSLFSASLRISLQGVLGRMEPGPALALFDAALSSLWILCVLPVLVYALARAFEVNPWACALGAAATGLVFTTALQLIIEGAEALARVPALTVARAVFWAGGVWLATMAARRGRRRSIVANEKARQVAEQNRTKYDEFLAEAQSAAERAFVNRSDSGERAERAEAGAPVNRSDSGERG